MKYLTTGYIKSENFLAIINDMDRYSLSFKITTVQQQHERLMEIKGRYIGNEDNDVQQLLMFMIEETFNLACALRYARYLIHRIAILNEAKEGVKMEIKGHTTTGNGEYNNVKMKKHINEHIRLGADIDRLKQELFNLPVNGMIITVDTQKKIAEYEETEMENTFLNV